MADKLKKLEVFARHHRKQNAFIVVRSITDNILMVQELVGGYGRLTLSPRCAIKVSS